jgi:hypothetical protein
MYGIITMKSPCVINVANSKLKQKFKNSMGMAKNEEKSFKKNHQKKETTIYCVPCLLGTVLGIVYTLVDLILQTSLGGI